MMMLECVAQIGSCRLVVVLTWYDSCNSAAGPEPRAELKATAVGYTHNSLSKQSVHKSHTLPGSLYALPQGSETMTIRQGPTDNNTVR